MKIRNVHERKIAAPIAQVGALLDTLASSNDRFWPHENWPAITFDKPLQIGAAGGHGTGPYTVTSYSPGKHIRFDFGGARNGYHEFSLRETDDRACLLTHTMQAEATLKSLLRWHLIRFVHNALIEDVLDKVEGQFTPLQRPTVWSAPAILLRRKFGLTSIKAKYPT